MKRLVFIALILVIAVPIAYFMVNQANTPALPFINPTDVQSEMVDSSVQNIGRNHKIGAFRLLDEQNKMITDEVIYGKVFVAEYFFTTCGSICPIMNQQMQRVQTAFDGNEAFEILSFTVDPENDKPKQLLDVLKPAEAANLGDAGSDFIHTNNFVLVDQDRHIRGYYDGTNPIEVDQLILDIEKLLKSK